MKEDMERYPGVVSELSNPNTSAHRLQQLTVEYPEFGAQIASHPNCYPELRQWIAEHVTGVSTSGQDVRLVENQTGVAEDSRYAGFISYSHSGDASFAASMQREVERFAKPWNKIRAIRLFPSRVCVCCFSFLCNFIHFLCSKRYSF